MINLDPNSTTLLTQFIINADRAIHLSADGTNGNGNNGDGGGTLAITNHVENEEDDGLQPMTAEQLAAACRARKTRSLILMAMQVAAFLGWDLDTLARYLI